MNSPLKLFLKNILLAILIAPVFCFGQTPVFGIKLGLVFANSTIEYTNPDNADFSKTSTMRGLLRRRAQAAAGQIKWKGPVPATLAGRAPWIEAREISPR